MALESSFLIAAPLRAFTCHLRRPVEHARSREVDSCRKPLYLLPVFQAAAKDFMRNMRHLC